MKINIFGREIQIKLLDQTKWNKKFGTNKEALDACGYTYYLKKEISILHRKAGRQMDWEMIEQTIWHEIGHVVERYAVYSTKAYEFTSSAFEIIPTLIPQVKKVIKEWKKEYHE